MSEIDFDFATRDDCLQQMVPSDLRAMISERDQIREENTELLEMLEEIALQIRRGTHIPNLYPQIFDTIAKAKGEQV